MNIREWIIAEVNITVVYDGLDLDSISRDRLRSMLPDVQPPIMADLPVVGGALVLNYEPLQTQCLIDQRRIRIGNAGRAEIERRPLSTIAQLAVTTREIVEGASIVAHGFNYEVLAYLEDENDIGRFLRVRFLNDPADLDNRFGGKIDSLDLRLHCVFDEKEYNFRFRPSGSDPSQLQISCNAHFPRETLPAAGDLQRQILAEYGNLRAIVEKI